MFFSSVPQWALSHVQYGWCLEVYWFPSLFCASNLCVTNIHCAAAPLCCAYLEAVFMLHSAVLLAAVMLMYSCLYSGGALRAAVSLCLCLCCGLSIYLLSSLCCTVYCAYPRLTFAVLAWTGCWNHVCVANLGSSLLTHSDTVPDYPLCCGVGYSVLRHSLLSVVWHLWRVLHAMTLSSMLACAGSVS